MVANFYCGTLDGAKLPSIVGRLLYRLSFANPCIVEDAFIFVFESMPEVDGYLSRPLKKFDECGL